MKQFFNFFNFSTFNYSLFNLSQDEVNIPILVFNVLGTADGSCIVTSDGSEIILDI